LIGLHLTIIITALKRLVKEKYIMEEDEMNAIDSILTRLRTAKQKFSSNISTLGMKDDNQRDALFEDIEKLMIDIKTHHTFGKSKRRRSRSTKRSKRLRRKSLK
jgi:hypothetical protein